MQPYKSLSGKGSGVTAFEIRENSIAVRCNDETYLYTYRSTGIDNVEEMKKHALAKKGLSTYIAQNNPDYESKY